MPSWLCQNGPMVSSGKIAAGDTRAGQIGGGKGSIRDTLRARGQESMMAVLGGDADKLTRSDLRARGDAVLASVRGGGGAGSNEATPGHLTVATMAPSARNALRMGAGRLGGCGAAAPEFWQQSSQPLSPPGMWWPGCADSPQVLNAGCSAQGGGHNQDSAGTCPIWGELPMKVDLDSLASARFALTPPPGL